MNPIPTVLSHLRFWAGGAEREMTDGQLLARFLQSHDESAFGVLMHRHGPMVLGVCRRVLRNDDAAEDVFQATFMVLLRQGGSIRRHEALAAWLHGVAHRLARRVWEDSIRRREHERRASASHTGVAGIEPSDLPLVLDEELSRLPEKYRSPLVLCCLEGRTLAEAARRLGWKDGTLAGRLSRARALLAERLSRRGVSPTLALVATQKAGECLATVPTSLIDSTVRLAALSTDPIAVAELSVRVGNLAEEMIQAMFLKKLKVVASTAVLALCLGVGAAVAAIHGLLPPQKVAESPPQARDQPSDNPKTPGVDLDGEPLPVEAVARFGSTRLKHRANYISSLHFTPDGKALISQSYGETRVWDLTLGRSVREFPPEAHPGNWHGTSLSPDGTILATPGANEQAVRLWDVVTCKPHRAFGNGRCTRVCYSPDGKLLASEGGSHFEVLGLWDPTTGKHLRSWSVERGAAFATPSVFTLDGKTLISAHQDNSVRFWDLTTGKETSRIALDLQGPRNLVRSPDGKFVAITSFGFQTPHIHLIDVAGRKVVRKLLAPDRTDEMGYKQRFGEIVFTPDSKTLLAAGIDDDLIFWEVATGQERRRLKGGFTNLGCMALSRDGKILASALHGKVIRLTDLTSGRDLFETSGHAIGVWGVQFAAGGERVATLGGGNSVSLWDARTGRDLGRLEGHTGSVLSLGLSVGGGQVITQGTDRTARFWDPMTRKEIRKVAISGRVTSMVYSPDGKSRVEYPETPDGKAMLQMMDSATGKERWRWRSDLPGASSFFTPDGRTLVVRSADLTICLLDAATGKEHKRYRIGNATDGGGRGYLAYTLVPSNDGKLLAYGSQRNELFVLETATGNVLHQLTRLPDGVSAITFAPGDRMLAWGGWNQPAIHLIELATGKERHRLGGTSGRVYALTFSPNGKQLLSGSEDTTAVVWDMTGRQRGLPPLVTTDFDTVWADLGSADSAKAYRLVQQMARSPGHAIHHLRARMKVVPEVDRKVVERLIADLDADDFATRDRASRDLDKLGEATVGPCEAALARNPSLELQRRLTTITTRWRRWWSDPEPEPLRSKRALEALELAGTDEARDLVASLAKGAEGAYLTEQARGALARLSKPR